MAQNDAPATILMHGVSENGPQAMKRMRMSHVRYGFRDGSDLDMV